MLHFNIFGTFLLYLFIKLLIYKQLFFLDLTFLFINLLPDILSFLTFPSFFPFPFPFHFFSLYPPFPCLLLFSFFPPFFSFPPFSIICINSFIHWIPSIPSHSIPFELIPPLNTQGPHACAKMNAEI